MTDAVLSLADVLDLVREGIAQAGSGVFYAGFVGISPSELSAVLHGRRKPSKKLLAYLGLEAVTVYRWKVTP